MQISYTYDPFGSPTATGASDANTQQYTGRETDGTGLQYNRARYYSPMLQRYISEDPLGFGDGDANLYAYVGNDPLNATDPSGPCADPGGAGIRYCVQAFIPQGTSGLVFWGDGRSPQANGGTYRFGQMIYQNSTTGQTSWSR